VTITKISLKTYRFLQEFVSSRVGIVLEVDKQYVFESRLAPIVKQHGLGSMNDLCELLRDRENAEHGRQVVEAMTTNETYFFRDPAQYEAIRTILLPRVRKSGR
jgi:chemotaxis protein methyltransferase CheR